MFSLSIIVELLTFIQRLGIVQDIVTPIIAATDTRISIGVIDEILARRVLDKMILRTAR